MRILLSILLLAIPALASTTPNDPAEEKPPKVEEVIVVTATRSERALGDLPVSTTVVREEEIEAAPSLVVDDLLRTVPGVNTPYSTSTNTFFGASTVSMRGLGAGKALVLVDGVPAHEPYFGTVLWQRVPMDSVQQIEVVRGANASLFGNFALGGTIHLLTRPVDRDSVRLDASYGTSETQRQAVTVDHLFTDRLGVRFSHHRFSTNGVLRIVTPGAVDVPAWNDTEVTSLRGDFTVSERTHGVVKAEASKTDLSAGTALSGSNFESVDLSASVRRAVGQGGVLSASVFHKDETLGLTNTAVLAGRATEFLSSLSEIPVKDTGASLEWFGTSSARMSLVSFGVDLRETRADEHRTSLNRSGAVTLQDAVEGTQRFAGAFAQASWRPNDRLEVLASGRVDYFRNTGENVVAGGATTVYPSTTTTQFDPRLSFRFQAGPRTALRGSVYRAFKAPTLRDLYRNAQTPTSTAIANPYLGPETLTGADVGIEWATPRLRAELNLFRNDIDELLTRVRVGAVPPTSQTQNVGSARSEGIEAMADAALTRSWSLRLTYAWTDAKILENPGDPELEGKSIENVVPHLGTASLRYRSDGGTSLGLRYRILSSAWGEAVNLARVPAHRILDVTASVPVRPWLEVYFVGENVLDEKYNYVINATNFRPAQTRTVSGGVRMRLEPRRGPRS